MNFLPYHYTEWTNCDGEVPPFNKELLCVYVHLGYYKIGRLTKILPSKLSVDNPHRETLYKYEGFPYKVLAWMAPVTSPPPMPSLEDLYRWDPKATFHS